MSLFLIWEVSPCDSFSLIVALTSSSDCQSKFLFHEESNQPRYSYYYKSL